MKRGFLFGLGTYLILGVIAGFVSAFRGDQIDLLTGAFLILICGPLSVLVIRRANQAPPNTSRSHAVGGWLVGLLIINAVILTLVGLGIIVGAK
jgi:hypothetical protein